MDVRIKMLVFAGFRRLLTESSTLVTPGFAIMQGWRTMDNGPKARSGKNVDNCPHRKRDNGPRPQYGWDFPEEIPEKFRKDPGNAERFLEFPSRVRLGCPKPYNSRHLRLPEHFQNSLPPSTAGDASFLRSGSGEGLSEPVMEFPALLRVSPRKTWLKVRATFP